MRGNFERPFFDAVCRGRVRRKFEAAVDYLLGVERLADLKDGGLGEEAKRAQAQRAVGFVGFGPR